MGAHDSKLFPVYVWELPVRIWHWVMAVCMVVLGVTGYLIGSPPPSLGGEASEHYLFGWIRFAHFAAAWVFTVVFVLRVIWAFVGNRFARELFMVPFDALRRDWWVGMFAQVRYYLFLGEARPWQGHNPLAAAGMFGMYVVGTVFMIVTGFALYGEGLGQGSWIFAAFSSWVLPLLGSSQNVHTLHHLGMWYLVCFTLVHLYMVIREDICADETIVGAMVSGWRVAKR